MKKSSVNKFSRGFFINKAENFKRISRVVRKDTPNKKKISRVARNDKFNKKQGVSWGSLAVISNGSVERSRNESEKTLYRIFIKTILKKHCTLA